MGAPGNAARLGSQPVPGGMRPPAPGSMPGPVPRAGLPVAAPPGGTPAGPLAGARPPSTQHALANGHMAGQRSALGGPHGDPRGLPRGFTGPGRGFQPPRGGGLASPLPHLVPVAGTPRGSPGGAVAAAPAAPAPRPWGNPGAPAPPGGDPRSYSQAGPSGRGAGPPPPPLRPPAFALSGASRPPGAPYAHAHMPPPPPGGLPGGLPPPPPPLPGAAPPPPVPGSRQPLPPPGAHDNPELVCSHPLAHTGCCVLCARDGITGAPASRSCRPPARGKSQT